MDQAEEQALREELQHLREENALLIEFAEKVRVWHSSEGPFPKSLLVLFELGEERTSEFWVNEAERALAWKKRRERANGEAEENERGAGG